MALFLSLFYHLIMFLALVSCIACGGCIAPGHLGERADFQQPRWCRILWVLILHYVLGLGLVSLLVAWFGLVGAVRPVWIFPSLFLMILYGGRRSLRNIRRILAQGRPQASTERAGQAAGFCVLIALAWGILMTCNLLIGGMLPPIFQDDLWYHVTLPGQWVISGYTDTFPHVFPSNYPLAMEAVYSVLLLAGDEILCPMLYAQVTIVLLWTVVVAVVRMAGIRRLLPGLFLPFLYIGANICIAPLGAGNDAAAALALLCGFVLVMDYLGDCPQIMGNGYFLATGFIFGTAFAIKLTALIFLGPILLGGLGICIFRRMPASVIMKIICLVIVGIVLAYLPWGIRGWLGSGNPVFPMARELFPIHGDYIASFRDSAKLNSLYPFTLEGFWRAVTDVDGLGHKIKIAMTGRDYMFGFLMIMAAFFWLLKSALWRVQGLIVLACILLFIFMRGHNETVRYLSICYPLSAPLLSELLGRLVDLMRPRSGILFLAALFAGGVYGTTTKQLQHADFRTIKWGFVPVVTSGQRETYARHAQFGPYYLDFRRFELQMRPGSRVILADGRYPYYLRRRAIWSDTRPIMERIWMHMGSTEIARDLGERGVDYMVISEKNMDARIDELVDRGFLVRKSTGASPQYGFRLFSVHTDSMLKRSGQ